MSKSQRIASSMPDVKFVMANDIRMAVYDVGVGPAVVLAHGFPEIAYSWRYQFKALSDAGFRVIAPDLRGYGQTDRPRNVEAYGIAQLAADMDGLLDALEIEKATFVGHDWGAFLCWDLPAIYPNRVAGVASLNVPYGIFRRLPEDPIEHLIRTKGHETYMVMIQKNGVADAALAKDPAALFHGIMRSGGITREQLAKAPIEYRNLHFSSLAAVEGNEFLSEEEVSTFAESFEKTGFTGGLNYYRNLSNNYAFLKDKSQHIDVPCLMIEVPNDHYMPNGPFDYMNYLIPDLEFAKIEDCGHWSQQERPETVNSILIDWLTRKFK